MGTITKKRVLFGGYAPVHFLCFRPVYERLLRDSRVEVFLTGGFRKKDAESITFNLDGFYDPFAVDRSHVVPLEDSRQRDFDVLVCSHLSDAMFPRSYGKSVQLFHGVSFKNLAVRDKALRYDVLCLPGRYHAERYQERGLVSEGGTECLITGFPKTDPLASEGLDRDALIRGLGLDPALPTILFAPTGEKYNALEVMGEEVVSAIVDDGRWNLLVKPHDHPKNQIDWFEALSNQEGAQMRVVRDLDVVPFLHAADILLTDASSVATEYTLLDRPIIFLDVPKLMKRVKKRAPALDLETYGRKTGKIVRKPEKLPKAISKLLADSSGQREVRVAMASHVFHHAGSAAERVTGVVLRAAGLATDLPEGVEIVEPLAREQTQETPDES